MTKEQFFGRCIGQRFIITDGNHESQYHLLSNIAVSYNNPAKINWSFNISDCQIIGRRISQMTDEEREKHTGLMNYETGYNEITSGGFNESFESLEYLFDIGIFPDAYFDELKWCVEIK